MRFFATLASAAALAIAMPALADPGDDDRENARGLKMERGDDDDDDRGRGRGEIRKLERQAIAVDPGRLRDKVRGERGDDDRDDRDDDDDRRRDGRVFVDRAVPVLIRSNDVPGDWREWRAREREAIARVRDRRDIPLSDRRFDRTLVEGRGLIAGCPPGLAAKYDGCIPRSRASGADGLLGLLGLRYDDLYRSDYRYDDGYFYRLAGGKISDYIPLLGGALAVGNRYPADYFNYAAPAYYSAYYGGDEDYLYRYADGGIFAVNPETQLIQSIVGLVTGNNWQIGQAMPAGYDVYNVPPAFRDRYADSADSWYRYDDGQIYEVDPKTRLIVAAISLLGQEI